MMERKLGPQFRFRKNRPARKMDFIQSVSRPTIDFDIHHIMALMASARMSYGVLDSRTWK